jgi:hypothetical protein
MRIKTRTFSWFRVAVLSWASVWMLLVPLFHVHPEADHRHGEAGHIHGGTIHTVWSQDLECEFDGHQQHVDQTKKSTQDGLTRVAQSPHAGDRHAELGFSVLNDSTDRKSLKPPVAQALGVPTAVDLGVERHVRIQENIAPVQPSVPGISTRAPRAPPSLFV